MMKTQFAWLMMVLAGAAALTGRAEEVYKMPSYSAAVDKAVSEENLLAVAGKTEDADVLLGLGFVAPTGSAARKDLLAKAVKLKPEYAAPAIVVRMEIDGVDDASIAELIKIDPNNALGHYLQATELQKNGKNAEALLAYRKGAACAEMRFYGTTTAEALFKALTVLRLEGRERLAALGWVSGRLEFFFINHVPAIPALGSFLARKADLSTRKEISDLLLVLSGQLYMTNFQVRKYGEETVRSAFRLKAEIAAEEKSPTMNGYVTVVQALTSVQMGWPGIAERGDLPLETAWDAPFRIFQAVACSDPEQFEKALAFDLKLKIAESDKARFEKAKLDIVKASDALVASAMKDSDELIGAYLKEVPPPKDGRTGPWVTRYTYVERQMEKRPEVFKAVAAYNKAFRELMQAGESDPGRQSGHRMLELAMAIYCYASEHQNAFPPNLEVLYKDKKYLDDSSRTKSASTGKEFVYVASGEKLPENGDDSGKFILAYDDQEVEGCYRCAMADGHSEAMPMQYVKDQLKKRGK